jgi:histidine triad (HIT) family protein
MSDCLFCRIIAGTAPASKIYEDDEIVAINDTSPQAPLHALVMPRRHIATLNDLQPEDDELIGKMMRRAAAIAKEKGVAERGYRTLFNCNRDALQSVFHIHLHVLGGRRFGWPPG